MSMLRVNGFRPRLRPALCGLVVGALVVGAVVAARAGRDVTADRLRSADQEPENWLVYGGTYRSLRHSPLDQITTSNVDKLQAAWAFQLGVIEWGLQSTPLVADGVMYVIGTNQRVFAIDAATGAQKWKYAYARQTTASGADAAAAARARTRRGVWRLATATCISARATTTSWRSTSTPARRSGGRSSRPGNRDAPCAPPRWSSATWSSWGRWAATWRTAGTWWR